MTDELLKLVVRKNELYVEWKTTAVDDPLFEQRKRNFQTYDNMIKYYIRNAKKTYFHNTFAMYKNDMKKTWAVISETLNKKERKDEPLSFKCNGRDLTDDIEIANEFNRFFADIGESLASNMEQFDNHELSYKTYLQTPHAKIVNFSLLMKTQQLKP